MASFLRILYRFGQHLLDPSNATIIRRLDSGKVEMPGASGPTPKVVFSFFFFFFFFRLLRSISPVEIAASLLCLGILPTTK